MWGGRVNGRQIRGSSRPLYLILVVSRLIHVHCPHRYKLQCFWKLVTRGNSFRPFVGCWNTNEPGGRCGSSDVRTEGHILSVYLILLVFLLVYLRIPPTEIRTIVFLKASNEARFFLVFYEIWTKERLGGERRPRWDTATSTIFISAVFRSRLAHWVQQHFITAAWLSWIFWDMLLSETHFSIWYQT